MNTYKIHYTFNGQGWVDIEADNENEAEDKFYNSDALDNAREETYQYEIKDIYQKHKE